MPYVYIAKMIHGPSNVKLVDVYFGVKQSKELVRGGAVG
jgi:hypothetical protein